LNPAISWRGSREEVGLSRYFAVVALIWVVGMMWRVYPQFGDTLRHDGRLMTLGDYVEESCGQRVGPARKSCLEEAKDTGARLVAREQGKSVLLVEAPLLGYLLVYLPLLGAVGWIKRRAAPFVAAARRSEASGS
jgi:hypothetical protein